MVRGDQGRSAPLALVADRLPNRAPSLPVEPGGGLVEDDEHRVARESKRHSDAPPLADRKTTDLPRDQGLQPEPGQDRRRRKWRRVVAPDERDQLRTRSVAGKAVS